MTFPRAYLRSLELFDPKCNKECECGTDVFTPVCLNTSSPKTFFSACHAGCQVSLRDSQTSSIYGYTNCTCLDDPNIILTTGFCGESCGEADTYVTILALLNFLLATTYIGSLIIILRSVAPADKTVATGFIGTAVCGLAYVPTPVLFGYLVDSSCVTWEESCGQRGSCWIYNGRDFSKKFHFAVATTLAVAGVSQLVIFTKARLINIRDEDSEAPPQSDSKEEHTLSLIHI